MGLRCEVRYWGREKTGERGGVYGGGGGGGGLI